MERGRKAAIVIGAVIAAAALIVAIAPRLWVPPPERTRVVVHGVTIEACFTVHIVAPDGTTLDTAGPLCDTTTSTALNGTYFGNTTSQLPVPITFLDPGNATCPGLYFHRYQIMSGWIEGFAVDLPVRIDEVTPPPRWDVVNFYGGRGYITVRMPIQAYEGTVHLKLTGLLNSPSGVPRCP